MKNLKKSIFISIGEKYLIFVIQFVASIIIARLLTPGELGIFSIGSIFLSFSHVLRDLGISNYVIQERNLTEQRIQTAQTLLFAFSWTLAIIVWLASLPVSAFYSEPGVQDVILVLSINFLILPFGSLASALLRRDMYFDRLFKINIGSALVHTATAISLCLLDFGFISLAWAGVAGTMTTVLLSAYYVPVKVRLFPIFADWRHILSIGGRFSGASLLWEGGLSGPELIVGKVINLESTAFLGRAQGIVGLVYRTMMEGLVPVLMPHFAQSHRAKDNVGDQFIKAAGNVIAVTFPIFACLFVIMDSAVRLLYGIQWESSIEPARILCIGMFGLTLAAVGGTAVAGMGEAKYSLRFQLVGQPIKLVLVFIGAFFSLSHVATAMAFGDWLIAIYVLLVLKKLTGYPWASLGRSMLSASFVAICAASACAAFAWTAAEIADLYLVFGCAISSVLGWLLGIALIRHPLGKELLNITKKLRQKLINNQRKP